jgi:hypothetical protein
MHDTTTYRDGVDASTDDAPAELFSDDASDDSILRGVLRRRDAICGAQHDVGGER